MSRVADGADSDVDRESASATDDVDASPVFDHRIALVVGLVGVALGIAAVAGVTVLPPPPERPVVTLVGAGLVLGGAAVGARRLVTDIDQADPPVVERRGDVTVPGASLDDEIATAVRGEFEERAAARRRIGDRLRETAGATLVAAERIPAEEASDRVDAGEWPGADALSGFAVERTGQATVDRIRSAAGRGSSVRRQVDRAVTALAGAMPTLEPHKGGTDRDSPSTRTRPSGDEDRDHDDGPADRRTRRWTGVAGAAMLTVGVGVFATLEGGSPSLVVAATAFVGAVAYAVVARPPDVSLAVERRVDADRPEPGEEVEVTVTVENAGENWLPDLRLVDGVPVGLRVVEGSPRYATALRPGESVRFSYAVTTTRGGHTFEELRAMARDPSGARERERQVDATGATELACTPDLDATGEVPVFAQTARRTGRVRTDVAGEGVEFHSIREYRQGDPLSRVDWNRVAATGEFATLEFHEERAATVVLAVDARRPSYVTDDVDGPAVPERQLGAADQLAAALLSAGDSVGLAAFSPEWCWLEPRGGDTQRARIRTHLATHAAFAPSRPTDPFYGRPPLRKLREELPGHAQLVVLSPLCDDRAVELLREFHARGYPVTVVSPDATGGGSTGQRLAAVERAANLSRLRRSGVRVVDWDPDRPLRTAVETAENRWSG